MHITRVPKTPRYVKGVINLRGVVTPIIDLRERFGLIASENEDNVRIIIIQLEDMEVGFVVDSANDVLDIQSTSIEQQPDSSWLIRRRVYFRCCKIRQALINFIAFR